MGTLALNLLTKFIFNQLQSYRTIQLLHRLDHQRIRRSRVLRNRKLTNQKTKTVTKTVTKTARRATTSKLRCCARILKNDKNSLQLKRTNFALTLLLPKKLKLKKKRL